jgi:hypothetical protein
MSVDLSVGSLQGHHVEAKSRRARGGRSCLDRGVQCAQETFQLSTPAFVSAATLRHAPQFRFRVYPSKQSHHRRRLRYPSSCSYLHATMASPRVNIPGSPSTARVPQVYQIDFTAVASGKRIASTKRRVRWYVLSQNNNDCCIKCYLRVKLVKKA